MAHVSFPTNLSAVDFTGVNFDTIEIDAQQLAASLAPFIIQGSKIHYLTRTDLNVYTVKYDTSSTVPNTERVTLAGGFSSLMKIGQNKFFDVLIFLAMDPGNRPQMQEIDEAHVEPPVSYGDIARAMFVQYFFILTRGRASQANSANLGSDMPKFLHTVLNCTETPLVYHDRLASFDLHKMGYEWVKHVPFQNIAREAYSRFGLGVAGYRMLSPFKLLRPRAGINQNLQDAYQVAYSMATNSASWDIHPATRNNAILQTYGPLNANLGNLMLEIFETAELQALVNRKVLFQMPVNDPSATQYRTWSGPYTPAGGSEIFGNP